jgi:5-methylcytosine-specific restriction endonuclease McrA
MSRKRLSFCQKRRKFLRAMLQKHGDLCCTWCGGCDLIILAEDDPEIPWHRRATIDHITPLSLGGSNKSIVNWQVSCQLCNQYRGNDIL